MGTGRAITGENRQVRTRSAGYARSLDEQRRRDELAGLVPPAETRAPSLTDQAIRDAILAERSRLLSGNSRRQAFRVGGTDRTATGS